MDFFTEEQEAKEWEQGLSDEQMNLEELIGLAKRGLRHAKKSAYPAQSAGTMLVYVFAASSQPPSTTTLTKWREFSS